MEVLQKSSEKIFVPLCIGGGIRDFTQLHQQAAVACGSQQEHL